MEGASGGEGVSRGCEQRYGTLHRLQGFHRGVPGKARRARKKRKNTPLGVITGASRPRGSPRRDALQRLQLGQQGVPCKRRASQRGHRQDRRGPDQVEECTSSGPHTYSQLASSSQLGLATNRPCRYSRMPRSISQKRQVVLYCKPKPNRIRLKKIKLLRIGCLLAQGLSS